MPESNLQKRDVDTDGVSSYKQRTGCKYRRYSPTMDIWKESVDVYRAESSEGKSIKEIEFNVIVSLFDKNEIEVCALNLSSIEEVALIELVSEDNEVILRSRAIEELLRRKADALPDIIVKELERSDIAKAWRNTLLLVAEHVQFTNLQHQEKLRECLKLHARNMKNECHPRTQIALRSLLRIILSLIVDWRYSLDLKSFLILGYPIQVKRIALLGIQNLFQNEPPSTEALQTLAPVQEAIASIAKSFLTRSVYDESEDEFYLGLDALDTLFHLADPCVRNIVIDVDGFADKWISRQIQKAIQERRETWSKGEFVEKDNCIALLDGCMNLIRER